MNSSPDPYRQFQPVGMAHSSTTLDIPKIDGGELEIVSLPIEWYAIEVAITRALVVENSGHFLRQVVLRTNQAVSTSAWADGKRYIIGDPQLKITRGYIQQRVARRGLIRRLELMNLRRERYENVAYVRVRSNARFA